MSAERLDSPQDMSSPAQPHACQFCRTRKIKCDKAHPRCSSCSAHGRQCTYKQEKPRPRPSHAIISALQNQKRALEDVLLRLKTAPSEDIQPMLDAIHVESGESKLPDEKSSPDTHQSIEPPPSEPHPHIVIQHDETSGVDGEPCDRFDPTHHVSVDDQGQVGIFGLTSTLHEHRGSIVGSAAAGTVYEEVKYQLIANAALERQKEYSIRLLPSIDGVPVNVAAHLLDLHWNRQHHTFLLTYRPALMRDLKHGGPYCSKLLLNAIFACASKYSDRIELRDDPTDPLTAGARFFRRCEELMVQESPFGKSTIPNIVACLLLGSTFVSKGEISKGWSCTGFACRMVYDLGLHLDWRKPVMGLEDVEIRRRVFWGAFICDKTQSLYLGRPCMLQLQDNHCPPEFMDTFEELDLWTPYADEEAMAKMPLLYEPTPVYSVSTFQQLCHLSRLMTKIMNYFYSCSTSAAKATADLVVLDKALQDWNKNLPPHLVFEPWTTKDICGPVSPTRKHVPPNIMNLHLIYHSITILLNRPFVSDGHLRSATIATTCWKRCTVAARNITSIVSAYRYAYRLRGAPYLTGYAAYVACTIHVRNAALDQGQDIRVGESSRFLSASLKALDELSLPNAGLARPASIIRRLMQRHGIAEATVPSPADMPSAPSNFDMDSSPQSAALSSLFDTFTAGQQDTNVMGGSNLWNVGDTPQTFPGDPSMNDSLFGFMNFGDPQLEPMG